MPSSLHKASRLQEMVERFFPRHLVFPAFCLPLKLANDGGVIEQQNRELVFDFL
jgi:hypothetical protein